jgi:hypothetical protein
MKQFEFFTLQEIVDAQLFRGDGIRSYDEIPPETICVNDLIVTTGRTYLAKRISAGDSVASAMAYMAVGTVSTAAALGDTTLTGEVKRKALSTSSTTAGDNNWTAVATFGGAADSVTSLALVEAGIFNHASSGQGTMFQRVTFASVTLANSDLVKITLTTNVGSS